MALWEMARLWHQIEGMYGAYHAGDVLDRAWSPCPLFEGPLCHLSGVLLVYGERKPSTAVSDFTVTACYLRVRPIILLLLGTLPVKRLIVAAL
jgi:hypothetical protein